MSIPPETVLATGGVGAVGWALKQILGPTFSNVGEALGRWSKYRLQNVARVAGNAAAKLGERAEEPGGIPARVAMRIFEEGSYSDDDLVVEYLGGVLASSRSNVGRDDRGNVYAALVARLSTYELRAHYIFYTLIREANLGRRVNFYEQPRASEAGTFVPYGVFYTAMDFSNPENPDVIIPHVLHGLNREELIGDMEAGPPQSIRSRIPEANEGGIIVAPSVPGVELYLWGHGRGDIEPIDYLRQDLELPKLADVAIPSGALLVAPPSGAEQESGDTEVRA